MTAPRTATVVTCPLCGEKESGALLSIPDRLHGTPGIFQYRRCKACRTVFQNPRVIPADLALCYPDDYLTHHGPRDDEPNQLEKAFAERRAGGLRDMLRAAIIAAVRGRPRTGMLGYAGRILAASRFLRERAFFELSDELLPRTAASLRALDIGCGSGYQMAALRHAGWEVEGVEWDPVAAEIARRVSKRPVRVGDFREVELPLAAYDLVLLSHVFEHLDVPLVALQRIKELLAPGGRAVLFYPNPESLGARIFHDKWHGWEAPRHLVLTPRAALQQAARRAGLIPLKITTTARFAGWFLAYSRAHKASRTIRSTRPDSRDQAIGYLESVLIRLGANIGEEIIAVLVKPAQEISDGRQS